MILGLYGENGKSNGNYYILGLIWGFYERYIGITEDKMQTTF